MDQPAYNADRLSDETSVISPNGGLRRWFVGLFAVIAMLAGLKLASHDSESPLYTAGLLLAALALAAIVYTINSGFNRKS